MAGGTLQLLVGCWDILGGETLQKSSFIRYPITIVLLFLYMKGAKAMFFLHAAAGLLDSSPKMLLSSSWRGTLKDSYLVLWE